MGMFHPSKLECDALEGLGNEDWNWESLFHYMKKVELLPLYSACLADRNLTQSENTVPDKMLSVELAERYSAVQKADPRLCGTRGTRQSSPDNLLA